MKFQARFALLFVSAAITCSYVSANGVVPQFSDYSVKVFRGELKVPTYYKKMDGEWRDDMGKLVSAPEINFAGKYHLGLHSCGADCRYYTLSDLKTGFDSSAIDMFSTVWENRKKLLTDEST